MASDEARETVLGQMPTEREHQQQGKAVAQLYVDAARLSGLAESAARNGLTVAAILMPAGFFLSSAGTARTSPNAFIWLLYAGAVSLGIGAVALGLGLLMSSG
jgi:hypothetical protein